MVKHKTIVKYHCADCGYVTDYILSKNGLVQRCKKCNSANLCMEL